MLKNYENKLTINSYMQEQQDDEWTDVSWTSVTDE